MATGHTQAQGDELATGMDISPGYTHTHTLTRWSCLLNFKTTIIHLTDTTEFYDILDNSW